MSDPIIVLSGSKGVQVGVGRGPDIGIQVGTTGPRGPAGPAGPAGPQGPMGVLNVMELSQAEYDALAVKQSNVIYVII